jgi:hypothetical protein
VPAAGLMIGHIQSSKRPGRVFVSPRVARREGEEDQDHEPGGNGGRLVILIFPALVTAGRTAGHTNTLCGRDR